MAWLDQMFRWFPLSLDMGIDLGTCNTLVCVRGEGIVLSEPSVVALKKGSRQVLLGGQAVGIVAKEMLGKTPEAVSVVRPLKDGVIADFDVTEALIRYFIQKVHKGRRWGKPLAIISVPSGITTVEKRAVVNSAERAGAGRVYLIPEPRAAGLGLGLPIQEPVGSLICDIGGGTSEVAVLSLGEIVTYKSIRIAGDEWDETLIAYLKGRYNLAIGPQMSEKIKIQIGSVSPLAEELTMEVKGLDLNNHVPRKVVLRSEEVREVLQGPLRDIIRAIGEVLEKTPPELSADLVDNGLILCGGGALLRGIEQAISEEIQISARVGKEPLHAVANGLSVILENLPAIQSTLESDEDI